MAFAAKPGLLDKGCWAYKPARSTGAMMQSWEQCGNRNRPGFLTCRHHAYLEEEAQTKKRKLEEGK